MSTDFKPMLAATLEANSQLNYPKMLSPKLDGVRCCIIGGVAYSRNMKPIRNAHVQAQIGKAKLNYLDGELIVGSPTDLGVFNTTQSGVMSGAGKPDFTFYVFDHWKHHARGAVYRNGCAEDAVDEFNKPYVKLVNQEMVSSESEMRASEEFWIAQGYEGVMLRHPGSTYKFGRATPREDSLWKVKRFIDGEAVVFGIEEAMENTNAATVDELGRTKRSGHKANLTPKGMVGTLVCATKTPGETLRVGPGTMTHLQRVHFWQNQNELVGKVIKYKAFAYGVKDMLRFPLFQGIRDENDL